MNTSFHSPLGKIEIPHAYVSSDRKKQKNESLFSRPYPFQKRLQRTCFGIQGVTILFFKEQRIQRIGNGVHNLKKQKILPWNRIINGRLILTIQKALYLGGKIFLIKQKREKVFKSLEQSRKKLKEGFQQLYYRITSERFEKSLLT